MEDIAKGLGIGLVLVVALIVVIGLIVGDADSPPSPFDAEPAQAMTPVGERLAAWGLVALVCVVAFIAAVKSDWWEILG